MKALSSAIASLLFVTALTPVMAQSVAETFDRTQKLEGGWVLKCLNEEDGKENCLMDQVFLKEMPSQDPKASGKMQNMEVLKITMGNFDNGKPLAVIAAPPGVALIPGMEITVDGQKLQSKVPTQDGKEELQSIQGLSYERCLPTGCISALPLSDETILNAIKKGNKMVVTFFPSPDPKQKVDVEIDLKGFTKAYDTTFKTPAAE